jgi:hypothetical protein
LTLIQRLGEQMQFQVHIDEDADDNIKIKLKELVLLAQLRNLKFY